jgi:Zn-dependent M28 family amino/carboxypeptidase
VLSNEHYGRIARLIDLGRDVRLEFTIVNRTYPGGTSYNAIGEIPGTDKADEVVMLGGHLDSWHSSTGATDNAIGCAIMMEAVRILQAVGAKPRRTIRVALWGGEEQGLLGSQAYVRDTFGFFEDAPRKPAYDKFSAYWNIDSGTGLVRGASIFGPPESARIIAQFIKPWEEFRSTARPPRPAATAAAPTTRHSTRPGCPASAAARTRSNTAATRTTPTSTRTSASCRMTSRRTR